MSNPCTELAASLAGALDPVEFHRRYLTSELPELDQWQIDALRDRSLNIQLLCGRQTGKSTLAALMACHQSVEWPKQLVLLVSPTLRQSSELFRKARVLVDAVRVKPKERRRTSTELELANGSKIVSLPGANPDAIRGYSKPDLIIEDESAFVGDKTFAAVRPMLAASANPRHILMTTPYGRRGHFHDLWRAEHPDWSRHTIKSEDCPRISQEFLEGEQRVLSDRSYRQEYLCEFLEATVAVFPSDLVERLMDENQRRTVLPDAEELRERRKELQNVKTVEELNKFHERHQIDPKGILSAMVQGPGPWAVLGESSQERDQEESDTRAEDGAPLLREHCRLNNELAHLKDRNQTVANRDQRIAELERNLKAVHADPAFPHDKVRGRKETVDA
ncbi:MAG: terminase large subunit [Pseudomonadota bacterium]